MKRFAMIGAAACTAATLGLLGTMDRGLATIQSTMSPAVNTTSDLLAQTFGNIPVNEANFLVVAAPGSVSQPYRLMIVEQLSNSRPCWQIPNANVRPTEINALWNTFDFTGVCRLQRDSNGYAVRAGGQDVNGARFEINNRNGDLLLQFAPSTTSRERITIGRTGGISSTGFTTIHLDPGWSLTKRTFEGQIVSSHLVYFTNNLTLAQLLEGVTTGGGTTPPVVTPPPTALPFTDIRNNLYVNEIVRAAGLGTISGFPDGRFQPTSPLTREQAVSVMMETAERILPSSLVATLPTAVFSAPFPDVQANRWSAVKIAQARQLGIVAGDAGTGQFRPTDNVSRAELMAMARKLALIRVDVNTGDVENAPPVPELDATTGALRPNITNPSVFSDISGHWGERVIREMAGFCGIATPLNETGTNFAPNTNALRDYTAAVSVRAMDCPAARRSL
jgi:N-acetylmuramoyl-L-alanine amidase